MRAALLCVLWLTSVVAHAQSGMESQQVTPEGLLGLQELVKRVQGGALGPEVTNATFTFSFQGLGSDGAVRLELEGKSIPRSGLYLLRPPLDWKGAPPRHFILFPDDGFDPARLTRVAALLDDLFPAPPWARAPDAPPNRYVPRPVSRTRVLAGFLFLLLTALAGLVYFLTVQPRRAEGLDG